MNPPSKNFSSYFSCIERLSDDLLAWAKTP
jgi:hypothetical protein